jgi:hypothetical protein
MAVAYDFSTGAKIMNAKEMIERSANLTSGLKNKL